MDEETMRRHARDGGEMALCTLFLLVVMAFSSGDDGKASNEQAPTAPSGIGTNVIPPAY